MTIKIGNTSIKRIQLGSSIVKSAYLGSKLVYGSAITNVPSEPVPGLWPDDEYNIFVFNVTDDTYNRVYLQNDRARDETEWDGLTDWGDGTINAERTHEYTKKGVYTVKTKWMINNGIYNNSDTVKMLIGIDNINKNICSFYHLFCGLRHLTSIDLDFSVFDVHRNSQFNCMFYGCYDLASLDLSSLDTSNVGDMSMMFYKCQSLTSLDLSNFDTYNVYRTESMFRGCSNLTYLDLSNFNMDKVVYMSNMFYGCYKLTLDNIIMTNCNDTTKSKIIEAFNNKNKLQTDDFGDPH